MLLILGLSLIPMGWAFLLSLSDSNLISSGEFVGLDNYRAMPDDPTLRHAFRNTFLFALLYLPLAVVGGLVVAMMLNQRIRFIGVYRTCFLVPFVASAAAEGILMGFVFDSDFGVVNYLLDTLGIGRQGLLQDPSQAIYVLAAVYFWTQFGFNVIIYLAALQDIPVEILEAASIDGAGRLAIFRRIVLPVVTPVTVFLCVWGAIETFQLFDIVYTTTRGGPLDATTTVVLYVWELAFTFFVAGYGAAVAYALFLATFVAVLGGLLYSRKRGYGL